ncbi:hypothetical protein RB201_00900 [Streptomyces sp. S1A(2023)]
MCDALRPGIPRKITDVDVPAPDRDRPPALHLGMGMGMGLGLGDERAERDDWKGHDPIAATAAVPLHESCSERYLVGRMRV